MFALPDYGENTVPPARYMPSSRLDAICMHRMQKLMADSYIEGRKYWAENPDAAPNEAQLEVEKFLEFTALLPKRTRPSEIEPVLIVSDEEDSSDLTSTSEQGFPRPPKVRPRWIRYLSFSSNVSSFPKAPSPSRSRLMSLPLIGKIQRPSFSPKRLRRFSRAITSPVLRRTASEPSKPSTQSKSTPAPKTRRMTLDESEIALASSRSSGTDTNTLVQPLSLPSSLCIARTPRFPCDYLPKASPTPTRKRRRRANTQDEKPKNFPKQSLAIIVPPQPLVILERYPPFGSPNCVRKVPLPPPEWFDTPFPEKEKPVAEIPAVQQEEEEALTWYNILLAPFALAALFVILPVFLIIYLLLTLFDVDE
ncbi:hypothetical protein GGU10DRAFT_399033 [Lentinula aff. detonsa]|uniref:Uncharacterized protein n=1 Tax=Lentinula aff. detonsa TaxID=2804958 RepID=A0AA38KG45_9AGAR|nr:hypothetical protein GGU10DRAFT_399033 [Lentinula aff. detonsa]